MKVEDVLKGVTKLGIDTAPLIYFVEKHPIYNPIVFPFFEQIATGKIDGVTSMITLTEILSFPIQQGNTFLQAQYRTLLTSSTHFVVLPIDLTIAETAAELRARYRLRTPDALQIAAALSVNCEAFFTNDKELKRVKELSILVVDELLNS